MSYQVFYMNSKAANANRYAREITDFDENYRAGEDNPYYTPMHKLWITVILQAMADAREDITTLKDNHPNGLCKISHLEARYLFENEDFGRTRLCELCDLAATPLRIVLKAYNNPEFDPNEAMRHVSNVNPAPVRQRTWEDFENRKNKRRRKALNKK